MWSRGDGARLLAKANEAIRPALRLARLPASYTAQRENDLLHMAWRDKFKDLMVDVRIAGLRFQTHAERRSFAWSKPDAPCRDRRHGRSRCRRGQRLINTYLRSKLALVQAVVIKTPTPETDRRRLKFQSKIRKWCARRDSNPKPPDP